MTRAFQRGIWHCHFFVSHGDEGDRRHTEAPCRRSCAIRVRTQERNVAFTALTLSSLVSVLVAQQQPTVQPFEWLRAWSSKGSPSIYQTRLMSFYVELRSNHDSTIDFHPSTSGKRLLQDLKELNSSQDEIARPMILVCYSFGCSTTQHVSKTQTNMFVLNFV
jgi:hypothetical protein